MQRKDMG